MVAVGGIKGAFTMGTESMVVTCWRPPRPCTGKSFATDRSVGASRRAAEQEATWPAHLPRVRLRGGVAMDPSDDGLGRMRRARPVGSPRAVAGLPSCHTVHVVVICAGTNDSTLRTAGDGRQRVPPSSPLPGWPHGQRGEGFVMGPSSNCAMFDFFHAVFCALSSS